MGSLCSDSDDAAWVLAAVPRQRDTAPIASIVMSNLLVYFATPARAWLDRVCRRTRCDCYVLYPGHDHTALEIANRFAISIIGYRLGNRNRNEIHLWTSLPDVHSYFLFLFASKSENRRGDRDKSNLVDNGCRALGIAWSNRLYHA